jgi:predicted permease
VVVLSLLLALLVGISTALLPAFHARRLDLSTSLQGGGRITQSQSGLRNTLIIAQVALSVVALVGAGLFARSLVNIQAVNLGLDVERLVTVTWEQDPALPAPSPEAQRTLVEGSLERLRYLPGTEAVVASSTIPFRSSWGVQVELPGGLEVPQLDSGGPYVHRVSQNYFSTVGLQILRGRAFGPQDRPGGPPVVIVNETMARTFWPGQDPLDQCLYVGGSDACTTVVGVAANTRRQRILEGEQFQLYLPLGQPTLATIPVSALLLRVQKGSTPETVARAAGKEILTDNPQLRRVTAAPLQAKIAPQTRSWRLGTILFGALASLALVVVGLGLYSILAFQVANRRRELAVRATLGADPWRLRRRLFLQSLRLSGLGLGIGLFIAWLARPFVEDLLYGISATDPGIYAAVTAALGAIAIASGWFPALHAGRTDPALAMQED